jgi:hypothetical protein
MIAMYKIVKTLQKTMVHSLWCSATDPFADKLEKHDPSFFEDEAMEVPADFAGMAYMLPALRAYWAQLDEADRAAVWAHLDYLSGLSKELRSSSPSAEFPLKSTPSTQATVES